METRKYRDTPDPGPVILTDILTTGKSEGWQGTIEELTALRELLAPFNVAYVDDMRGTWRLVKGLNR